MIWLANNWFWLLVGSIFVLTHVFGHGSHGRHGRAHRDHADNGETPITTCAPTRPNRQVADATPPKPHQ